MSGGNETGSKERKMTNSADDRFADHKGSVLHERLKRIFQAVSLEKPDRTPVVLEYAGFAATVTNTPLAEFLGSIGKAIETMIKAFHIVGAADAIDYGAYNPYNLAYLWMSKVSVPGVDLPDDAMYQVVEKELMAADGYDQILSQGWPKYYADFMKERVFNDVPPERLPSAQPPVDLRSIWAAYHIPVLTGGSVSLPFELLCGARSLPEFFNDLLTIPDKVQEVVDIIMPHLVGPVCKKVKGSGFPAIWVGGWRSASNMISPRLWERFVWPYIERAVHEVTSSGLIAILHLDSDWTRDLAYFKSLPKGKCILATDGQTDLFRAKEILGDRMCVMGDVPAAMLAFGTPREVFDYSSKLIRELGPTGFILHSGCDIPIDAKLENVQAMVTAALRQ
ncbi:MAG: uroporphyrinogen decarboxylase family protein [Thermodesulfobacteriota bacterium]